MRTIRIAAVAILAAALFSPRDAVTCGPFFPEYEFALLHGPVDPYAFARGELGVVRPHFYREPLLIAYRYFAGVPLTASEAASLYPPAPAPAAPPETAVQRWLAERSRVAGAPKIDFIIQDRPLPGKDQYQSFPNCLDDAFTAAAATLRDRARRWGAGPQLTEWLRGQDQVFQNCSGGATIPAALAASADPLLVADRAYQIAAAEFYATQFDAAERDFDAISRASNSPWRDSGAYLATRALIREGTLLNRPEKLREAKTRLAALASEPRWQASARGLESFLAATLDPKGTLVKLGEEWMRPGLGARARRVLTDYTHLCDREGVEPPAAASEIADWLVSFQSGGKSQEHIVERWRASATAPWLVASLVWSDPKSAAAPDLIAAARKLEPASPAYATAAYYGIRLQIERGELDAAREWADAALATKQPVSVENLLRAERLRLARNWDEFLEYAVRRPAAVTTFEGGDEPSEQSPPAFDLDVTTVMNRATPLAYWKRAVESPIVPRALQEDIVQADWVRAVILDDRAGSQAFAARLRDARPAAAAAMRDYLAHPDPFTAAFWMLRMPGFSPELRSGMGRRTELGKVDSFRDNWWSLAPSVSSPEPDRNHEPLHDLYPPGRIGPTEFLPAADRASGERQNQQLSAAAANGVNYLCKIAIEYSQSHPGDPRVPEALHLAVRATRYGMVDEASHAFSKQAFEILHRRYPASEWARQTKYWY